MEQRLWYQKPASHWEEGLPLGNGRLGAMELGGGKQARISLNEGTLWSGYPKDTNRHGAAAFYPQARDLALNGRLHEAQKLIEQEMLGGFTQSYLPLGDLLIAHVSADAQQYIRRELSLARAVHITEYVLDGVRFVRQTFVSHPAQAIFIKISANMPASLSLSVRLDSQLQHTVSASGDRIVLDALAPSDVVPSYLDCDDPVRYDDEPERYGMRCRAELRALVTGGQTEAAGPELRITGADCVELRLAARTSFRNFHTHPFLAGRDEKALCADDHVLLQSVGWEQALQNHIDDYRRYNDRAGLMLGSDDFDGVPTDERLIRPDAGDQAIFALLFHYGRYLLIASSRPGGQAANLQGIWCQDLRAIWSCNYTLNINLQMNYWVAEITALPEMAEPLFGLIEDLCAAGQKTARIHYGANGAVAHHNTDLWRLCNPVGEQYPGFAGCAFWPLALGWLCRHLTEHWRYSDDLEFLERRALPALRHTVRFLLDTAVPDGSGYLTFAPATSPENIFLYEGKPCKVGRRSAMTTEIMRELLRHYLAALDTLNLQEPMAGEASSALKQLSPPSYGSLGQMLEWELEYPEPEPHHRHVSQLYGLYPGQSIAAGTEAAKASAQTLKLRGDDGTGWSLAWKAALWARLGDGEHALALLRRQLQPVSPGTAPNLTHGGSYLSLLCAHPPFQIDGNFGACAAVCEMLLQADDDRVTLLPALPGAWSNGEVRGLRAPHGTRISFRFSQGRVTYAKIEKKPHTVFDVLINGKKFPLDTKSPLVFLYESAHE